jgi:hypothetical protein
MTTKAKRCAARQTCNCRRLWYLISLSPGYVFGESGPSRGVEVDNESDIYGVCAVANMSCLDIRLSWSAADVYIAGTARAAAE